MQKQLLTYDAEIWGFKVHQSIEDEYNFLLRCPTYYVEIEHHINARYWHEPFIQNVIFDDSDKG